MVRQFLTKGTDRVHTELRARQGKQAQGQLNREEQITLLSLLLEQTGTQKVGLGLEHKPRQHLDNLLTWCKLQTDASFFRRQAVVPRLHPVNARHS